MAGAAPDIRIDAQVFWEREGVALDAPVGLHDLQFLFRRSRPGALLVENEELISKEDIVAG